MLIDEAKNFFEGDVSAVPPELLQKAAKVILSELDKAAEKISELEKKVFYGMEDLPGEIWRDVEGYNGIYQISNKGRIKSNHYGKSVILKIGLSNRNYFMVNLTLFNKTKRQSIHRLVAMAFIPNPENLPFVNHIDGNKQNNCVENLEWVTARENSLHAHKLGLLKLKCGTDHKFSKLTAEEIKFIRKNHMPRDKEFGAKALAKKFNVAHSTICSIVSYKRYKNIV